ncbi:hypothetical protein B0537_01595 [Desulforamulus ferrireducens]|uniref:Uncharacterized protein n=1 Tax=Desulforamulus ferrireducens TaxID=1833852 RepID=A0A1S6IT04_9FIRM|nr:hypothetical protein B0537_01595 [Desulforamulus ferrireducens]
MTGGVPIVLGLSGLAPGIRRLGGCIRDQPGPAMAFRPLDSSLQAEGMYSAPRNPPFFCSFFGQPLAGAL